jgi:hypothetical protein
MSAKLERMNMGGNNLEELRDQLKRIRGQFQERMQVYTWRYRAKTHEGRYSHWDFPEVSYHDVKMKLM